MKILKFTPILKSTLWGGDKIERLKSLPSATGTIGESWELSGVAGSETTLADGSHATLNQLVALHRERLVGQHVYQTYGDTFPLLVKFIDARQNLSVQVHPDDETARRHGHERGKTEMWYVMQSSPDAFVYSGLSHDLTPQQYEQMASAGNICQALNRCSASEGDVFHLPAGRIHAIGAGCFLAEIQQTSDVTYRIYDYGRKDKDGVPRPLHADLAAEAVDLTATLSCRTTYDLHPDGTTTLVDCPYFTVNLHDAACPHTIDQSHLDSFVILIGLRGEGKVTTDSDSATLRAGQTLLVPADNRRIALEGDMQLLEAHIGQGK